MEGDAETTRTVVERWREARENLLRVKTKKSSRGRDDGDLKHWKKNA